MMLSPKRFPGGLNTCEAGLCKLSLTPLPSKQTFTSWHHVLSWLIQLNTWQNDGKILENTFPVNTTLQKDRMEPLAIVIGYSMQF
jgi:hypothetical protein